MTDKTEIWTYIPLYDREADGVFESDDQPFSDWWAFFEQYGATEEDARDFVKSLYKLIVRHERHGVVTLEEFSPDWVEEQFADSRREAEEANPPMSFNYSV